ncbi:hypothetical protein [Goodfellowiella coeruleoviolacea]|uniref:hypothetical protein n=1 Tax=Goodfellowiella coeruleoviolacea TaxID=334858 RepID=UPI0020A3FF6A|nr:hypothetical protein [Goodfellowiella coeruleoviolacea]
MEGADDQWEHVEVEYPEGEDAYSELVTGELEWYGEWLRLRWLPPDEAAEVIREQEFADPWGEPELCPGFRLLWSRLKSGFRRRA